MAFNYFLIFILISLKSVCLCFELLSGAVTGLGVVAFSASYALKCKYLECCDDTWIRFNEQGIIKKYIVYCHMFITVFIAYYYKCSFISLYNNS